jgi:pimeloyl-ACP methyl ester carboxylesterase
MTTPTPLTLDCDAVTIEAARWDPPAATGVPIVLLHEGLGCVDLWRDFPARLAHATGRTVYAYSRRGYGRSAPLAAPRRPDYLHDESRRGLASVLDALGLGRAVLFGHSDGASIALIHAAEAPARVAGVVALAPHVFVEELTLCGLRATRDAWQAGGLRPRLARWHADVDGAFHGWNDVWLSPEFRDWSIEALLPSIAAPVLAIQGADDEYGTLEQPWRIRAGHPATELLVLDGCGHAPHRERTEAVLAATVRFLGGA